MVKSALLTIQAEEFVLPELQTCTKSMHWLIYVASLVTLTQASCHAHKVAQFLAIRLYQLRSPAIHCTDTPVGGKAALPCSKGGSETHFCICSTQRGARFVKEIVHSLHPCTSPPESHLFFLLPMDTKGRTTVAFPFRVCVPTRGKVYHFPPAPPCLCFTSFHTNPRYF